MTRGIKILLYFLIITIITCLIFFSYSFTKKIRADLKHKDILLLKDYRGKLLPETQFTKLYLKKIPLDKDSNLNIEKKSMKIVLEVHFSSFFNNEISKIHFFV